MSELLPRPGPLGRTHGAARRLGEAADHPAFRQDLLFGKRGIKRPIVAVATKKELGNCRHALSQMVVAGTMVVHPPMRPGEKPKEAARTEPRVLTFTPPPPKDAEPLPPRPPTQAPKAAIPTAPSRGRSPPPPAGHAARPQPGAPRTDRGDRVVTIERKTVEDFNPLPREDE